MTRRALALLLSLAAAAAGCAPGDGCGSVSQWLTEPADLVVAGNYAFAAVAWHPVDAGCFGSRTRIHAIELGASPGPRASKKVPGSVLGEGVSTGGAAFFSSGADEEVFRVDATPPFDLDRVGTPGVPTNGAAAGGRAFFVSYFEDAVVSLPESGEPVSIAVQQPIDVVATGGKIYATSGTGSVSEIDPATGTVERELASCVSAGPLTATSGGTLLIGCEGFGAGVLDLATGSFDTDGTNLSVTALSGATEGALWSIDGAVDRYTQVYQPGAGGIGEQLGGWLVDDAVFEGDHAFASLDGTPWRVALSGSGSSILTGFASDAGARLAAGGGELLVLEGGSGSGARLHRRDLASGDPIDVIELPSP